MGYNGASTGPRPPGAGQCANAHLAARDTFSGNSDCILASKYHKYLLAIGYGSDLCVQAALSDENASQAHSTLQQRQFYTNLGYGHGNSFTGRCLVKNEM